MDRSRQLTSAADRVTDRRIVGAAQRYVDTWLPGRRAGPLRPAMAPRRDVAYCRRVAARFDESPLRTYGDRLARRYRQFTRETRRQFQAVLDAGIAVEPWLGPGQPYTGAARLRESVLDTGLLYFYPTRAGHGPGPPVADHPMVEPSGIVRGDVELAHNDLFRVVHDVFGHVMFGCGFSLWGEFSASFHQMSMYSDEVHPVLFTEQVAQICWYFHGPHLDTGAPRRYPPQKVLELPGHLLAEFRDLFARHDEES